MEDVSVNANWNSGGMPILTSDKTDLKGKKYGTRDKEIFPIDKKVNSTGRHNNPKCVGI